MKNSSFGKRSFQFFYPFLLTLVIFLCSPIKAKEKDIGPEYDSIKFGVLVKNDIYTIYRSAKLGESGLFKLKKYLEKQDLPFPKNIIYMNKNGYKFPFYFALDEYFLKEAYDFNFIHSFGPNRTYVDGHNPFEPRDDIDKNSLGRTAKKIFESYDDGIDGGIDTFMKVLNMVLNPEMQPILFHCHGGRHRTGMIAMAIRHLQGGPWTSDKRYKRWGMKLNPAEYEYYKFNRSLFRKSNINFMRKFVKDKRFIQLQDKYGELLR